MHTSRSRTEMFNMWKRNYKRDTWRKAPRMRDNWTKASPAHFSSSRIFGRCFASYSCTKANRASYFAMSPTNREPPCAKWNLPSHAPTFGFRPVYGSYITGPSCLGRHSLDPGKDHHARTPAFWWTWKTTRNKKVEIIMTAVNRWSEILAEWLTMTRAEIDCSTGRPENARRVALAQA